MTGVAHVPIFDFMMIRPPESLDGSRAQAGYIRDTVLRKGAGFTDVDLPSAESASAIGRLVYRKVFCEPASTNRIEAMTSLRNAVLALLTPYRPPCDGAPEGGGLYRSTGMAYLGGRRPVDGETLVPDPDPAPVALPPAQPLDIRDLQRHSYVRLGDLFFLLPDRLDVIDGPLIGRLPGVLAAATAAVGAGANFSASALAADVTRALDGQPPYPAVFSGSEFEPGYAATRRALFDALYVLYVLRRWTSVNFEPVMDGLRALHVLEALAIDELVARAVAGQLTGADQATLGSLSRTWPALRRLTTGVSLTGFPLLGSAELVAERLAARPVVHPIFARLYGYARPFNTIQPIGIGDLKVVKQTLVAYEAGEISDIHNVMQGEQKVRTHRRRERTEDVFSSTTTTSQEVTHDTASTDRFELRREAEQVIKQDINVNANVRAQYDNKVVLVTAGAGFAYNRSQTDQSKVAQNFGREVVSKAVDRIQSSTVSVRSTTKLFETEETNTHTHDNVGDGRTHISGIFRWVDKRYKAQVYNYGRRLMFEFVLPEPAALYVQSRLRYFEATLDFPQEPQEPTYKVLDLGFTAYDIDEARFNELREKYDLSAFSFPQQTRTVAFVDQENNTTLLTGSAPNPEWWSKAYTCRLNAGGYAITKLLRGGTVFFVSSGQTAWTKRNFFDVSIDGQPIAQLAWDSAALKAFYRPTDDLTLATPYVIAENSDTVTLSLSFQALHHYTMEVSAELTITQDRLRKWQAQVYDVVSKAAAKDVEDTNRELKTQYQAAMVAYRNRMDEIRATAIHDLIQGQSEAYNKDLVTTELRRQCLSVLTKEFDAYSDDDLLTDWESMGAREVTVAPERLVSATTADSTTTLAFTPQPQPAPYPLPDLNAARDKGRYIQFLEQGFEWTRLGYVCYPYFWATTPKWMELMGRLDDADPNFTAFLRAGAVKVLVAVTQAYEDAVLHFLATREPWEGGPAPAIDDPLYLPLFEELRRAQDDRYGGTPDGDPWEFTLPTALVYLEGSSTQLPTLPQATP